MGSTGSSSVINKQSQQDKIKSMLERISNERIQKMKDDGIAKPWNCSKMYTYEIDGQQIKTNYGAFTYAYWDGTNGIDKPHTTVGIGQSPADVISSLIERGYDTFQLKQYATRVKGYVETVIFYSNTLKKKK